MIKIALFGLDFPLGKKNLPDERLERLKEILHSPKVTYIQIEFQDKSHLKNSDCILTDKNNKLDLILEDLEAIDLKIAQEQAAQTLELFKRIKTSLENENLLCEVNLSEEEKNILLNFNFITLKPVIVVSSDDLSNTSGLIQRIYKASGRICFYTSNERELRAWQIKYGITAFEAAGLIHSDIQRGFIKAEVITSEEIIKSGSLAAAKAKGSMRLEDKNYIVKDGDWINFRFNV